MTTLFKVWDHSRTTKKMVLARSLFDLLPKAKAKLKLDAVDSADLRVVLEKDGTEVDEDEALVYLKDEAFMILQPGQNWTNETVTDSSSADIETSASTDSNTSESSGYRTTPCASMEMSPTLSVSTVNSSLANIGIPTFSDYVKAKLHSGESHIVWNKMIQEAAYYYMCHYPQIGISNSSSDYRDVGQQMIQAFPSVRREGTNPWSLFSSALSQKIRRIRWDNKRKSQPSPTASDILKKSPKRFRIDTGDDSRIVDGESYEEHVKELQTEMERKNVDETHVKTLMRNTFKQRRTWVGQLPSGEVAPLLQKFPCLKDVRYIMHEFKMILKLQDLGKVVERLELVFETASTFMKNGSRAEDVDILHFIESETGFKHGKGKKSKSVLQDVKLTGSVKLENLLSSPEKSPPRICAVINEESQNVNMAIVADQMYVLLDTEKLQYAVLVLVAFYYITDLEYPRCFSQLLGIIQHVVIQHPFEGLKTNLFTKFLNRLQVAMEKNVE